MQTKNSIVEDVAAEKKYFEIIFDLLRSAKGVDFAYYKPPTVRRRISRRMILLKLSKFTDYVKVLKKSKTELNYLYDDMLINVTRFFREPDVFDTLKKQSLIKITKNKTKNDVVKIWVPGCSSGEEVYSIAICLAEVLGKKMSKVPVKIFGSDINEKCLTKARRGIYDGTITNDVSAGRLKRFFTKDGNSYKVSKQLRDMCIFSKQNVLDDPQYSNLDLVSCRNLLIYMQPALQKKIVNIFNYALRPGGFLQLGNSESLCGSSDAFKELNIKNKLFVKKQSVLKPPKQSQEKHNPRANTSVKRGKISLSSEELQSANEELETAKEELQSSNEELLTTNEELQERNIELDTIKRSVDDAREYSESVINTIREPLIALDQDLRVVSVSRSFYEFFKVKPAETVGQLIYNLGNKQWDIPGLRELLETILPKKATFDNYEVEHDFATIGRRIMLLNARQIQRVMGKDRIILLAIEDITERRKIENGLEKAHEELNALANELQRTARVKSEFLANMSHELRTPLNSINGFSEVLYDETFGKLNNKQKVYVNNVLTSGKHLLLLINQILDMAKVESGKMNLALACLPLKELLHEMSLLVADMVSKKNIHMVLEIGEELPNIEADELKIKEILYNLLSNAVKFTHGGGKIGIRTRTNASEVEIVVWDTGIGIAAENMGKIFEGFFRVDTPYSRVTEGTGLGLSLSKKFVELHGGRIFVESAGLGKGTSVRFTLPIVSKKAA